MSAPRRPVILLVQQSRDDGLEMYAEFLRHSGLAPVAVSSAQDALAVARGADLIATGIILDGRMDGVELVSCLRRDEGTMHKPIIMLTTCAWPEERERAERAGCDVFLSKPCLPDALLREVQQLLLAVPVYDAAGALPRRTALVGPPARAIPHGGQIEWDRVSSPIAPSGAFLREPLRPEARSQGRGGARAATPLRPSR